jgi:putative ABC transport system permease protein
VKNSGLERETSPQAYIPFSERPTNFLGLAVRAEGDPVGVAERIRAEVRALDRNQPVQRLQIMSRTLDDAVARPRFNLVLLGGFAFLALMLAAVGIYGVVSCGVTQRTHEIGVRMALGAQRGNVLRMVVGEGMRLAGLGVVLGLGGSLAAADVLASLLFGIPPHDALTFAAVAVLLIAVALAACWLPARRATRVDPSVALRYE